MTIFNRSVLLLPWYFPFKAPSCHLLFSLIHLHLSVPLGIPSSPTALTIAHWQDTEGFTQVQRGDICGISLGKLGFLKVPGEHGMCICTFYKTKWYFSPLISVWFSFKFCFEKSWFLFTQSTFSFPSIQFSPS